MRYQVTKSKRGFEYGDPTRPTTFYKDFVVIALNLNSARKLAKKKSQTYGTIVRIRRLKKGQRGFWN
jgi:hypothetical protein